METQKEDSLNMSDKLIAIGTITGQYHWFDKKEEELTEHELAFITNTLHTHTYTNGYRGVVLSVKIGKAIKASLASPIKQRKGIVQSIKNKIKEIFA
jgi:hypothetical protein